MTSDRVRVLIADDHAEFRDGMTALLGSDNEVEVVGAACDGAQAVEMAARLQDQRLAEVVEPLLRPGPLFEHGPALGRRQPVDDEPQGLAGRMRGDGLNAMNHC